LPFEVFHGNIGDGGEKRTFDRVQKAFRGIAAMDRPASRK
jgi:hypothetical protein